MKILHVLNGAIGGASISTLDLIDGLAARGHQSFIYCSARVSAEAKKELERRSKVPVYFGPLYFWNLRNRKPLVLRPLIELYQLACTRGLHKSSTLIAQLCGDLKIDLIHSSTAMSPDGAIAACQLGLPHVWHVREMIGPGQLHRLAGDNRGAAARRMQRTGFVIANSESSCQALFGTSAAPPGVAVVHNGFDFSRLPASLSEPLSDGRVAFGMVANLSSTWKRHELFLRAAAIVAKAHPTARFKLYGEIPAEKSSPEARAYYQGLQVIVAELGIERQLDFCGYQADVASIMAAVDVVVHPCESESFGRVFVEASAAGRALIAARGGAAPEIIHDGETGVLVPPGDVSALADAMLTLLAQPEYARGMAAKAQHHVRQNYDLTVSSQRIEAIYEEAHRQAASGPGPQGFLTALWRTLH
ncbi:MAG: glycosyltransferase family 4 protein [Pseudomonadota bacterium]